MQTKQHRSQGWLLVFIGGLFPLLLVLGTQFHLPERLLVPLLVVIALVFASMAVWMRANAHATGEEWWQDDSCSGWRGY
jgi:Mn2+/Fe2+ NRAMP family transporter